MTNTTPSNLTIPDGWTQEQWVAALRGTLKAETGGRAHSPMGPVLRKRRFTDDELCQLYQWIVDNEWSKLHNEDCWRVRLLLGTGMRISEAVLLQIGVNCWKDGYIEVSDQSKSKRARALRITPELQRHWKARFEDLPDGEYLCRALLSHQIPPLAPRALWTSWNRVCDQAGVRKLEGAHGARHTYASWELGMKRRTLEEISAFLGHRNIFITYQFYVSVIAEIDGPPKWPEIAMQGNVRPVFNKPAKKKRKEDV